jgi:hypothetical protein
MKLQYNFGLTKKDYIVPTLAIISTIGLVVLIMVKSPLAWFLLLALLWAFSSNQKEEDKYL